MKSTIFIPKIINVGYQNRSGTYTGKLAYVIYTDEKGVRRKEASWNSWRDHTIEPDTFNNEPTSGFVLNKKVGDTCSHWNFRQAYCRVYDPRGFEFEITIENLLYILENTNSIVGKGLEGDFVYGWDGKDLVLLPTCSSDYKEIEQYSKTVLEAKSITAKMLKIGCTYLGKDGNHYVYLGKYPTYSSFYYAHIVDWPQVLEGKQFWFAVYGDKGLQEIDTSCLLFKKSLSKGFLIDIEDENPHLQLSEFMQALEHSCHYSPVDLENVQIKEFTKDEFYEHIKSMQNRGSCYGVRFCSAPFNNIATKYTLKLWKGFKLIKCGDFYYQDKELLSIPWDNDSMSYDLLTKENIDKVYDIIKPIYIELYLKNGYKYSTEYIWYPITK